MNEFYIGTKSNFGKPWDFEIGWVEDFLIM